MLISGVLFKPRKLDTKTNIPFLCFVLPVRCIIRDKSPGVLVADGICSLGLARQQHFQADPSTFPPAVDSLRDRLPLACMGGLDMRGDRECTGRAVVCHSIAVNPEDAVCQPRGMLVLSIDLVAQTHRHYRRPLDLGWNPVSSSGGKRVSQLGPLRSRGTQDQIKHSCRFRCTPPGSDHQGGRSRV